MTLIAWNSKSLLVAGFTTVVLLMALLVGIDFSIMNSNVSRIDSLVRENTQKSLLIAQMRRVTRERTVSLQKMLIMQDPFARDAEAQVFRDSGAQFIAARDQLLALDLTEEEQRRIQEVLDEVSVNAPFQLDLVDLILSDQLTGVQQGLDQVAIPRQEKIYAALTDFLTYQDQIASDAVSGARRAYDKALYMMSWLALLVLVLSGIIAFYVIRRITLSELRLKKERERAHITLHSIGDAVVTVDQQGLIEQMNGVAEQLTGIRLRDVQGKPCSAVLHLFNEVDNLPAPVPLASALASGEVNTSEGDVVLVQPDGNQLAIEYTAAPIPGEGDEASGAILVFRDVTEMRNLTQQLAHQARHDELTGLYNRREIEVCLEQELAEVRRYPDRTSWLCFMDMDQFKLINDTCGHAAGDEMLKQIAAVLHSRLREMDLVSRIGGDEFAWLISGCSREDAVHRVEGIRSAIEEYRFSWGDKSYKPTASIGMTPITPGSGSALDLMSAADAACYVSKENGRNRIHLYEQNDVVIERRTGEMEMVHKLNQALERDGFALYGQIIKPLTEGSGRPHIEILVRMLGDDGEKILPTVFIPAAERYNLMPRIDRWVISNTLRTFSGILNMEPDGDCCVCINLSAQSICEPEFLPFVLSELDKSSRPAGDLCFEITETAAIANFTNAMKFIGAIKKKGCLFALDDFGSGLSSFAYLKNLPVDFLKIDGCFVRDMEDDPIDFAMVESISQIGRVMGIETIAEYVENAEIMALLQNIGVGYGQGYGIGHPMPVEALRQNMSLQLSA